MGLTSNQKETLHALVVGQCTGMLTHPIPSLIEKGLVVAVQDVKNTPLFGGRAGVSWKLTPLGLEEYLKIRTIQHKARVKRLEDEYQSDMSRARGITHENKS